MSRLLRISWKHGKETAWLSKKSFIAPHAFPFSAFVLWNSWGQLVASVSETVNTLGTLKQTSVRAISIYSLKLTRYTATYNLFSIVCHTVMSNWKIKSVHMFISCSSIFHSIVCVIQVREVKTRGEQSLGAWTVECQVLITSFIPSRVDFLLTQYCLHSKMLDGQFESNSSVLAVTFT